MKRLSKSKSLLLTRQTLRTLAAPELDNARGGKFYPPPSFDDPATWFVCITDSFTAFCPRSLG